MIMAGLFLACAALAPLPRFVPDAVGWERIEGEISLPSADWRYHLLLHPDRRGIYELAHYQAMPKQNGRRTSECSEKVAWVTLNGTRWNTRFFERVKRRSWKKLWLGKSWCWREIPRGTWQYKYELIVVMFVYTLPQYPGHRRLEYSNSPLQSSKRP